MDAEEKIKEAGPSRVIELKNGKKVLLPKTCSSPDRQYTVDNLLKIIDSDSHSVLITGETGTGKEAFADCIFDRTKLPQNRCQRINCAGLDRNFIASELFGHVKGAYTGADSPRTGLLRECNRGILFLDEIGWLPKDLQARLLRFMETGEIRPLGSDKVETAKVRIIAATNRDVEEHLIPDLRARFDFEVQLPPLRERGLDRFWFMAQPEFWGSQHSYTCLTYRTFFAIAVRQWPLNTRELKRYLTQRLLLGPDSPAGYKAKYFRYTPAMRAVVSLMRREAYDDVFDDEFLFDKREVQKWEEFGMLTITCIDKRYPTRFGLGRPNLAAVEMRDGSDSTMPTEIANIAAILIPFIVDIANFGSGPTLDIPQGPFISLAKLGDLIAKERNIPATFDLASLSELLSLDYKDFKDFWAEEPDLSGVWKSLSGCADQLVAKARVGQYCDPLFVPSNGLMATCQRRLDQLFGTLSASWPTAEAATFPTILGQAALSASEKQVCEHCHRGLSSRAIGAQLSMSTAKVKEILNQIRTAHPKLAPFLPRVKAGRKKAKQPR